MYILSPKTYVIEKGGSYLRSFSGLDRYIPIYSQCESTVSINNNNGHSREYNVMVWELLISLYTTLNSSGGYLGKPDQTISMWTPDTYNMPIIMIVVWAFGMGVMVRAFAILICLTDSCLPYSTSSIYRGIQFDRSHIQELNNYSCIVCCCKLEVQWFIPC